MRPVTVHIWHRWWVLGWAITVVLVVIVAAFLPWWAWVLTALIGFLLPELWAIAHEPSSTPPLTSILRRYVPSWAAFPILAGATGYVTTALATDRAGITTAVTIGSMVAGWGIEHFVTTYFQVNRKGKR